MKTAEESNKIQRKQHYTARKIYQLVEDEALFDGRARVAADLGVGRMDSIRAHCLPVRGRCCSMSGFNAEYF